MKSTNRKTNSYIKQNNSFDKKHSNHRSGKRSVNMVATLLVVVAAFTVCFFLSDTVRSSAKSTERDKMVTSVYVEKGDNLWDIASKYYTKDCGSMRDYIKEIKRTNNISSDTIYYGYSILIPYYR